MVGPEALLVLTVAGVGVLHTLVPDHWLPIAVIARQHGWTRPQIVRAALGAGFGHVTTTLLLGLVVWLVGVALAARFGAVVSTISSLALVAFGVWIAVGAWRELRTGAHERVQMDLAGAAAGSGTVLGHRHAHVHSGGVEHVHYHEHEPESWHAVEESAEAPLHDHAHKTSPRTALLLILGSSPMIEGIPAFFAASRYGTGLIAVMAIVFGISTMATYVALCVTSTGGMQRIDLGPLERYGEVLSGAFVAAVGAIFLIWPAF